METDIKELNKRHFLSHARQPEVKPFSFQYNLRSGDFFFPKKKKKNRLIAGYFQ